MSGPKRLFDPGIAEPPEIDRADPPEGDDPRSTPPGASPAAEHDVDERDLRHLTGAGRRRWPIVVAALLVTILVVLGLAFRWVRQQLDPPGEPGEEITVVIPEGASKSAIADQLETEGVIANATVFELYARMQGAGNWQAGQYPMRLDSSADDVLAVLDAGGGEAPFDQVTVPEGLSVFAGAGVPAAGSLVDQIMTVDRFAVRDVMAPLLSGELRSAYQPAGQPSLEGLLFPDTYRIEHDEDEADLLGRMVERFDQVARDLGYDDATARISAATGGQVQLTPYEAVIVASLIERETKIPEERAMVARVIYNRLAVGNPLGIDASTVYALGGRRPETESDVNVDSPYNTRTNQGLPPTPIAVPGEDALRAALEPTPGDWFYYVLTDESGRHTFTVTAAEFEQAAAECRAKGLC